MTKQKLSPVKYEAAFVPPQINFRLKKNNNNNNKHLLNTLLPLVFSNFGSYHQHQLELLSACCQKFHAISEPVSFFSQVCLVL